jgi:hypothetical protein
MSSRNSLQSFSLLPLLLMYLGDRAALAKGVELISLYIHLGISEVYTHSFCSKLLVLLYEYLMQIISEKHGNFYFLARTVLV